MAGAKTRAVLKGIVALAPPAGGIRYQKPMPWSLWDFQRCKMEVRLGQFSLSNSISRLFLKPFLWHTPCLGFVDPPLGLKFPQPWPPLFMVWTEMQVDASRCKVTFRPKYLRKEGWSLRARHDPDSATGLSDANSPNSSNQKCSSICDRCDQICLVGLEAGSIAFVASLVRGPRWQRSKSLRTDKAMQLPGWHWNIRTCRNSLLIVDITKS